MGCDEPAGQSFSGGRPSRLPSRAVGRTVAAMIPKWLAVYALPLVGVGAGAAVNETIPAGHVPVYFGTYTGRASKGIYAARLDTVTGRLSAPTLAAEVVSPAFLAWHPDRRFLYAVNEVGSFNGQPGGAISAFAVDPGSGELRLINQESSRGGGPCHLAVDPSGKALLEDA